MRIVKFSLYNFTIGLTFASLILLLPAVLRAQREDNRQTVNVTIILSNYTYPIGISTDGTYISGAYFGGSVNYFWSAASGIVQIPGTVYGISDNGLTTGTFSNPGVLYNGSNVQTAGRWDHTTSQWTFTGMNPLSPTLFSTDYNSGWDITADGNTIVGLQYYPGYQFSAFKWTQSGGYEDIGSGVGTGSRASGISANGTVIYGWAQTSTASRTPVVWYNNQAILINQAQQGEAYGASTTGNYVTGNLNGQGFRWSPQGTITFSNTLNNGSINPSSVLNDGTIFGYTDTSFPPNPLSRRAFARDSAGVLMTFNDYAQARGLANAQQWTFYSINDATADGLKVIGGGKTPEGQNVTFIMEFPNPVPSIAADPLALDFGNQVVGSASGYQSVTIKNGGGGTLHLESITLGGTNASQFLLNDNNSYPVSLSYGDSIQVSVAFKPLSDGPKMATLDISATGSSLQIPLSGTGIWQVGTPDHFRTTLKIYPNPATDQITIESSVEIQKISIVDLTGRILIEKTGNFKTSLNLSLIGLKPGLYQVLLHTPNTLLLTRPLILQP